jgi:elongation factor P
MFGPTDLRKDTLIEIDGQPYRVVDYAQKQLGRGGSIVNTKLKNLVTGSVLDRTFKNDEKIKPADLSRQAVQYLYADHNQLHFMDNQTYEQFDIALSVDEEIPKYIVEGGTIDALVYDGQIIGFEWPKNVVLKVVSAPGADKGNSASATTKEVKLETGITAQTPQFIKVGDRLKIDTRSGTYLERAK